MSTGTGVAIGIGIGVVVVGGAAAAYYLTRRSPAPTSATTPSPAPSGVTTSPTPSTPSTSPPSSSPTSSSSPPTPVAVNLGGAAPNQAGQQVTLQVVANASQLVAIAQPSGFQDPVFQFWFQPPAGTASEWGRPVQDGWVSWVGYGPTSTTTIPVLVPGTYRVIVYAREASAPVSNAAAYSPQYEAVSNTLQVTVG
jgi:hypothetical protein